MKRGLSFTSYKISRILPVLLLLGATIFGAATVCAQSGGGSSALDELNAKLDEIQADIDRLNGGKAQPAPNNQPSPGSRASPKAPGAPAYSPPSTNDQTGPVGGMQAQLARQYQDMMRLFNEKKFDEAIPVARKLVEYSERSLGKSNSGTLAAQNMLATLYIAVRRYGEAEPILTQSCAILSQTQGAEHYNTLNAQRILATLYGAQGRFAEGEALLKRAAEIYEKKNGRDHLNTLNRVSNLAAFHASQGRFSQAEELYKRVLQGRERALGKQHRDVTSVVSAIAALDSVLGRYDLAEPLYKRAVDASEHGQGKDSPAALDAVANLAGLYMVELRFAESETLYRRVFETRERVLGRDHADTMEGARNLASAYSAQQRHGEAEALLRRVAETYERGYGRNHHRTLMAYADLASVYTEEQRFSEAEPLLKRAVQAFDQDDGLAADPLKYVYLATVAKLYLGQGRYDEAAPQFSRAYEGAEKILGAGHPVTGLLRCVVASPYFRKGDWPRAMENLKACSDVTIRNTQRGTLRASQAMTGKTRSRSELFNGVFQTQVKAAYRLASRGGDLEQTARDMFETAQWAVSSDTAQSMMQMASRGVKRDPRLAALVRERQDLVGEWEMRDRLVTEALGQGSRERSASGENQNQARLKEIDARIAEIDARLRQEFPDYATLTGSTPLALQDVQNLLRRDEALVFILDTKEDKPTPEESFIWVVTAMDARWVRADIGGAGLAQDVLAMRCGLDATAWANPSCGELTGKSYTDADMNANNPPPFDPQRAHRLYKALFGEVEDLIKNKQLLLVLSGPMTQLPFQSLVTAPPRSGDDMKSVAWLARDHAVTVLPAVSSLYALRRVARPSDAQRPMIGFGNPLLSGTGGAFSQRAQAAQQNQSCPEAPMHVAEATRGLAPLPKQGGLASVSHIRMQSPLPETVQELCAVARDVGADNNDLHLGARATETEIKTLSEAGQLAQYRIVHFATHGALPGQIFGSSEPGLLLTPPAVASAEDDGYLSASEIAALKLDADWVILSACNTAAGVSEGSETLSGLSRAFIYAQARALLVSHWAVDSTSAVKLITGAIGEMSQNARVGRAEALRRSMLAMIDNGEGREAHPAYWAPFVVVGEGAR